MHHPTRALARGAVLGLVVAAVLSACGGPDGSSAPTDATVEDFCALLTDVDLSNAAAFSDDLISIGTPTGIPAEARAGFEVMIEEASSDSLTDEDTEKVGAFVSYYTTTCVGATG